MSLTQKPVLGQQAVFNANEYRGDRRYLEYEQSLFNHYNKNPSSYNHTEYVRVNPVPQGYQPTGFLASQGLGHFHNGLTTTTVTTQTTTVNQQQQANVIHKDAVVTHVQDQAVLGNIIEKRNVEVVHKPVVQEIHEQKIIELEKQNVLRNVQQDTVVQRSTDQTRYEEVGNRDLEAERVRLAQLNVAGAPVVTRQQGLSTQSHQGEVVAQVVRQEHIERHVQPVITEVREQNIVQEVVHPVVRRVHEQTIIREVGSTHAPVTAFNIHEYKGDQRFLTYEQSLFNHYSQHGDNFNYEEWVRVNPAPQGYQPTGFLASHGLGRFHNTNSSHTQYENRLLSAQRQQGNAWNQDVWVKSNPAPAGYQFRQFGQAHTSSHADPLHAQYETRLLDAQRHGGSSWNQDSWVKTNPAPAGYVFGHHHQAVVGEGSHSTKFNEKGRGITGNAPVVPVDVVNPSLNAKHDPTTGTVVPTTTLGEAPAHTHEVLKGAAAGAAIGSVVPVVGTIVGGVIGAIGGAIVKNKHIKEGTHAFKE